MTDQTFVIVGAGVTGAKAAETLRAEGFDGRVVLIGDEHERPYERPPLSKGYLMGDQDAAEAYLHDTDWYRDQDIELVLGRGATGLDPVRHEVRLTDGEAYRYTKLLLATGACPRHLHSPGADLDNVHYLRRFPDSDRIAAAIRSGGRIVVVGAGWIGLETAAAARLAGCQVTVVEPQPIPLATAVGDRIGDYFAGVHIAHGVDLRRGRAVARFHGDTAVTAVETDSGDVIEADAVIVGIGVRPCTELAEAAGLDVGNGILVDAALRTSDPDIHAAGDVANLDLPRYGRTRVEHWDNAMRSGPAAAKAMLGGAVEYDYLPYFFTDQYDVGMEFVGRVSSGDDLVIRGDLPGNAFQAFWLADGKVTAAMHVNLWDDGIDPARELVEKQSRVDRDILADPDRPLTDAVT